MMHIILLSLLACTPEPCDSGEPIAAGNNVSGLAGLGELGATNVIFFHVDTLRADHLPHYGYERDTLPQIADMPWLTVDQMYAATSWTIPSTSSLLTGLGIASHHVGHMGGSGNFNAHITDPTLPQHFTDMGYSTFAYSGNEALRGLEGAFDGFTHAMEPVTGPDNRDANWQVDQLLAWTDTLAPGTPFFAFVQPMNTHDPYLPSDEFFGNWSDPETLPFSITDTREEQLADLEQAYHDAATEEEKQAVVEALLAVYDETILSVGKAVERAKRGLEARGLAQDTLIVLTADHGESLGDNRIAAGRLDIGHGGTLRQETVHIPLMFHHPRLLEGTETCLSQNVDTLPTVLDALNLPKMEGIEGQSLAEGCRDYAHSALMAPNQDADLLWAINATDGENLLMWDCAEGDAYRYILTTDPKAESNLTEESFPKAAELEAQILNFKVGFDAWTTAPNCPD